MNSLERVLYKTRKTIRQACKEAGIDFEEAEVNSLLECSHCNWWGKPSDLVPDLDDNPICKVCLRYEGM